MEDFETKYQLPGSNVTLQALEMKPQQNLSTVKLAVLVHPWSWLGGSMFDPVLNHICEILVERGYHVIRFNSRGVGESTGWASFTAVPEATDLQALVKLLKDQLKPESILLVGYSHGSIPVSHHPPRVDDTPVSHVLLSYPLSPLPYLTAFHHATHAAAIQRLLADTSSRVLVIYGTRDQFTAVGKYDTWVQGMQGTDLTIQRISGDHFWSQFSINRMLTTIEKWLDNEQK